MAVAGACAFLCSKVSLRHPAPHSSIAQFTMHSLLSFLLLCFAGIVAAVSSSGSRLLVVLEDAAEKSKYSRFWKDLEGKADFYASSSSDSYS